MIPTSELPQRELVRRLRILIDDVSDPEYRICDPEGFAESYLRLVNILKHNETKLATRYVQHNLGKRRMGFIDEIRKAL